MSKRSFRETFLLPKSLGLALCAVGAPAFAEESGGPTALPGVEVEGERRRADTPLITQPLEEVPQTITVIQDARLREQGVFSLRDSLRNVTGVSIVAGEGNPPTGDAMKIRGFAARDDILVDGMADLGNYLRDPFFAESIEVFQGPSSAIAGRGNAGGTINLVTRRPIMETIRAATVTVGSDDLYRGEMDVNLILDEDRGIAARFNAMGHSGNEPGRDHVEHHRWGTNLALGYGLGHRTRVVGNWLHVRQNDLPDLGLPNVRDFAMLGSGLEGRVAPVDFSSFYGYTTDYRDVDANIVTVRFDHDFSDAQRLMSQFRYGRSHIDAIVSAPRIFGASNSIPAGGAPQPLTAITPTTMINGLQKPRTETDTIWANQTSLTTILPAAGMRHTLVQGIEASNERNFNRRRLDINGPAYSLFDPGFAAAPPIAFQGTRAQVTTGIVAAFVFDNIEFSPMWEANLGLRYDRVDTHVESFDDTGLFPGYVLNLQRVDREWTGNASLVFHPVQNASLYVGYATAFETAGRHDIVNIQGRTNAPPTTPANFNTGPERTRSFEVGGRWQWNQLELSGAYFRARKSNARTPGINANDAAAATNDVHEVDGFTLGANGEVAEHWTMFANYTYLEGEVTASSNAFEIGQRLDNLPRHSLSLWSTYQITPTFRIGAGLLHVGERTSNVRPNPGFDLTVVSPGYTIYDAVAVWRAHENVELRLNLNNLTDERYIQGVQPGQSIPGPRRQISLSVTAGY